MRPLLLFMVGCLMFFTAPAKENKDLMRANFYYSHYAYFKAIPYFEKVAGELNDPVIYTRLAECYTVTGDMQKAAASYGKAVATPGCESGVMLRYAQVLMQLMQYDDAAQWLTKYKQAKPGDRRAANLLKGCSNARLAMDAIPEGRATLLPFNTDGSDFGPTRWKDRLVFASDTATGVKKKTDSWTGRTYYNLFSVKCDDRGNCDSVLEKVADAKGMNIKYHDGPCTFSPDGRQMYFTRSRYNDKFFGKKAISNKDSTVLLEIMIASDYDTAARRFRTITPFPYNSEKYAVAHPAISPDGNTLAFSSNMPEGSGGSDIYLCHKEGSSWSKPQNAGSAVNTEGEEVFPYWSDNNTLFFSSDGHEGLGGLDIYHSTLNSDHTFSAPQPCGLPVNSSYDDISLAMRTDGGSTYFSSNRPATREGDNIWFYRREKIFLQLTVLDSLTMQPLAGSRLDIDAMKNRKQATADNAGQFFTQLYPGAEYAISVSYADYGATGISLTATGTKDIDTIVRVVKLYKPAPRREQEHIDPVIPRSRNVMDTPGIREFELGAIYELGRFHYDYDKYDLKAEHKTMLDTLLTQLKRHPTMAIEIRAHTDCRGSYEYNQVLSRNRAMSVYNYLVQHGIDKSRLSYVGLGFSEPTIPCPDCASCTEAQHFLNRLLEFKVLKL